MIHLDWKAVFGKIDRCGQKLKWPLIRYPQNRVPNSGHTTLATQMYFHLSKFILLGGVLPCNSSWINTYLKNLPMRPKIEVAIVWDPSEGVPKWGHCSVTVLYLSRNLSKWQFSMDINPKNHFKLSIYLLLLIYGPKTEFLWSCSIIS